MPRIPSYRKRKGYSQAIVTLADSVMRERRYWLGEYGTTESRERYHRLIAQWESNDRRLPSPTFDRPAAELAEGSTIAEVVYDYWQYAKDRADEGEF